MEVRPVLLEGELLRLEPLEPRHAAGLWGAAGDPVIWRWFPFRISSRPEAEQMIAMFRAAAEQGSLLGFAQILRATGEIVGSTSYLAIEPAHLPAGRVQDRFREPAVACGAGADWRERGGDLPLAHGARRRQPPRQRLLQRDRPGMASRPEPPRSDARAGSPLRSLSRATAYVIPPIDVSRAAA